MPPNPNPIPQAQPIPETLLEAVAQRLRILGQPVRIRIVERLAAHGETTVQTLADQIAISQQHMSWHLGLLQRVGILTRRPDGRRVWYSLTDTTAFSLIQTACELTGQSGASSPTARDAGRSSDLESGR